MKIRSPLSNLCEVLAGVKSSAELYRKTLNKNEAATRAVLIDPILRALGWDTANTSMVEVEKTKASTRADYALQDNNRVVKVVVEAKALGSNLEHPDILKAIVQYAYAYGIEDIYVTDGLLWHHYTTFQPGKLAPAQVLDGGDGNVVDCAAYLVQRLDAAKYWPREPDIDVLQQQIADLTSAVATLQQDLKKFKTARPSAPRTRVRVSTTQIPGLVALSDVGDATGKKPTKLRLPDGQIIPVKSWLDVLRECCKYVMAHNSALPIPLPDRAGKKVSLLSTVRPAKGLSSVRETYNGQPIYIYLNYDANNHIQNAIHILKRLPPTSDSVDVAVTYV